MQKMTALSLVLVLTLSGCWMTDTGTNPLRTHCLSGGWITDDSQTWTTYDREWYARRVSGDTVTDTVTLIREDQKHYVIVGNERLPYNDIRELEELAGELERDQDCLNRRS